MEHLGCGMLEARCVWSEWLFTPPASQAKNAKVFHRGLWHVGRIILCISPIIALRESRWIIPMMALDCGSTLWLNVKDLPRYPLVIKHVNMGNPCKSPICIFVDDFPVETSSGGFPRFEHRRVYQFYLLVRGRLFVDVTLQFQVEYCRVIRVNHVAALSL